MTKDEIARLPELLQQTSPTEFFDGYFIVGISIDEPAQSIWVMNDGGDPARRKVIENAILHQAQLISEARYQK